MRVTRLDGGRGDDVVAGGDGNDRALLGDGTDHFAWNPGDDSDVVEGQGGTDALDFNGSGAPENVDVSANGGRVHFTRDVAAIAMDLDDVERLNFRAAGGTDRVVVNDLDGTGVTGVDVDLNAYGGGGDLQPDTVVARGTDGANSVAVSSSAGKVLVSGMSAPVQVFGSEAALDTTDVATLGGADTIRTGVTVSGPESVNVDGGDGADVAQYSGTAAADTISLAANGAEASATGPASARLDTTAVESLVVLGLGGDDVIAGVGDLASLTALTLDGGIGNDDLHGANGSDLLIGGDGHDAVDGNMGSDRAQLGRGDDRFRWDPGDGSDIVDGQSGNDLAELFGSNGSETITIDAIGRRARVRRDLGSVTMDLGTVERLGVHAFSGTDLVVVNDLAGTGVGIADVDLNTFAGVGDTPSDRRQAGVPVSKGSSRPC